MAQASAASRDVGSGGTSLRVRVRRFGSFLADLLEMGQAPVHLATVIGAVLRYDHAKDEEAQELLETIRIGRRTLS